MQRQVLVIQKAQITVDVPLLQYIDTTVDVPVAKRRREDTTGTARGPHKEVQRNQGGQKRCVQHSSGPRTRSGMSTTVKVGATCVTSE